MTRQNYYAKRGVRRRKEIDEELIVELVKAERRIQPRLGGRKTLSLIARELEEAGVEVGRDRFFEVMRGHDLLVERKRGRTPKTTNSRHALPVYGNLIKDREASHPNEIWVSDVTYIRTLEGYLYAALMTDGYSRKIVGSYMGESLDTETCMKALEEGLSGLLEGEHPIHHSDRGSSYCNHRYVAKLVESGCEVSMTEVNHCAENALAERVNGILKQEYGMGETFKTKRQARRAFRQAVDLYNRRRPHTSLGLRIPAEVHAERAA